MRFESNIVSVAGDAGAGLAQHAPGGPPWLPGVALLRAGRRVPYLSLRVGAGAGTHLPVRVRRQSQVRAPVLPTAVDQERRHQIL